MKTTKRSSSSPFHMSLLSAGLGVALVAGCATTKADNVVDARADERRATERYDQKTAEQHAEQRQEKQELAARQEDQKNELTADRLEATSEARTDVGLAVADFEKARTDVATDLARRLARMDGELGQLVTAVQNGKKTGDRYGAALQTTREQQQRARDAAQSVSNATASQFRDVRAQAEAAVSAYERSLHSLKDEVRG
jgi:hypothetical protein